MDHDKISDPRRAALAPVALAAVVTIGVTILFQRTLWLAEQPGSVTLSFLLFLPFATSAVAAFVGDPKGLRDRSYYLKIPGYILLGVVMTGLFLFREGVICVLMLAPLWWLAGIAGTLTTYWLRHRIRERGRLFCSALLALPLVTSTAEANIGQPIGQFDVIRSVVVDAPPAAIWPNLVNIPDVRSDEGRWNVAQDVLRIPRPEGATLEVRRDGLVRLASWQRGVHFEERITTVDPGKSIRWTFAFPDPSVRNSTDRHISPDGPHLKILTGAYEMTPLAEGRTLVVLRTTYLLRSPLNAYANWWGNLLLGGIQSNVLAIVKERSEA